MNDIIFIQLTLFNLNNGTFMMKQLVLQLAFVMRIVYETISIIIKTIMFYKLLL